MDIQVIGAGYVGLVQAAGLAALGHRVVCVEHNEDKLEQLQAGVVPFFEPGLDDLMKEGVQNGRLTFAHPSENTAVPQIYFIAVGTPTKDESDEADLSYVLAAADYIADHSKACDGVFVAIKSTVPVGTADRVREVLYANNRNDSSLFVISNPEFLREGSAVFDFFNPDRIVLGSTHEGACKIVERMYLSTDFRQIKAPVVRTDNRSAELIKYASNTHLALRISFVNELAHLCDACGADIRSVAHGMGLDKRIGLAFLEAGIGFGGSCFPKDVRALVATGRHFDTNMHISQAAIDVNERQKHALLDLANAYFDGNLAGKKFALWGLAFKSNTDDVRESPGVWLARELAEVGASVECFDPKASVTGTRALSDDSNVVVVGASEILNDPLSLFVTPKDALFICTDWPAFKVLPALLAEHIGVVFDGRNMFEPKDMREAGISYFGIGRG